MTQKQNCYRETKRQKFRLPTVPECALPSSTHTQQSVEQTNMGAASFKWYFLFMVHMARCYEYICPEICNCYITNVTTDCKERELAELPDGIHPEVRCSNLQKIKPENITPFFNAAFEKFSKIKMGFQRALFFNSRPECDVRCMSQVRKQTVVWRYGKLGHTFIYKRMYPGANEQGIRAALMK